MDRTPQQEEKRSRHWPLRADLIQTFEEGAAIAKEWRQAGHEVVIINWGGQWLTVRARPGGSR